MLRFAELVIAKVGPVLPVMVSEPPKKVLPALLMVRVLVPLSVRPPVPEKLPVKLSGTVWLIWSELPLAIVMVPVPLNEPICAVLPTAVFMTESVVPLAITNAVAAPNPPLPERARVPTGSVANPV